MEETTIAELTPVSRKKILEARVYRKWISRSITKQVQVTFCCILIDREGNAIQADMNLKELDYINRKLKIGQAYRIAKFICEPVNPWQQTINIKTTLKFGLATTFDTISAATFPCHYFDFVTYNQLESRIPVEDENSKMQFPILTDYIGCLRSVGQLKEKGEANKSQTVWRKLEIENLNGNVIEFTMWDEMAKKFEDAKLDTMQQPIIIAISSCSVSKYRDYQLSATPATYYYLNPNIAEAEQSRAEYTARYQMKPPLKICKTTYKDEWLEMKRNGFPLKTLLRQNPDSYKAVRFTSDAKITSIDMDKNWYYTSCNKCSRKVTEQDDVYSCLDHGEQEKLFYKYNFKGLITDPSATAPITFFTPAANDVVGYTCEQLVENHSPANPKQMPPEITIVKGQQHVFQFHFNTTGSKTDFILDAVFTNKKSTQETTSMSIATQGIRVRSRTSPNCHFSHNGSNSKMLIQRVFGNAYLCTSPEVARRLILIALCLDCNLESSEVMTCECDKKFQCLHGDGGTLT